MKNNRLFLIAALLFAFVVGMGVQAQAKRIKLKDSTAVAGAEPWVLNNNGDGTLTIKAFGTGADRGESVENAVRQALRYTLFKGFSEGPGATTPIKPLIMEVNAEEKYDYFFTPFFRLDGEFQKFAYEDRENYKGRAKSKSSSRKGVGTTVIVDRAALKNYLIDNDIIKP